MNRKGLLNWVKSGITKLVDPDRERRIEAATTSINRELARQKKAFQLAPVVEKLEISEKELEEAKAQVYRGALERVTRDDEISESEAASLNFIAGALGLRGVAEAELNESAAREVVARVLAKAFEDGVIDDSEAAHLGRIAKWVGLGKGELVSRYFHKEGESFLLGLFLSAVGDGHLSKEEWTRLCDSTAKLGLMQDDLQAAISRHATSFVERIFVNVKSDGRLSGEEEQYVRWLMDVLEIPDRTARYFEEQIRELRIFTNIQEGRLPSIVPPPRFEARAAEIVHFYDDAVFIQVRDLKSGRKIDRYTGTAAVTDNRFVFASAEKTMTVSLRQIVECVPFQEGVELRTSGRGNGIYDFGAQAKLATAILKVAIGRANQTIVERVDSPMSRSIPREVRQRVWQKYGGQCAECRATQYLEFDHIIPHSRGGSNSDNNIQLLCRGCNLKKLDHI
ncbi:HNH endonuclease [Planctomyces sp. SH-PL14]|nr:HNH endonuclease [Planctomyces sp. SH-PL14]